MTEWSFVPTSREEIEAHSAAAVRLVSQVALGCWHKE